MEKEIIINLSRELNIKEKQIVAVLEMLKDGATIPFIARYRKEATGALDEEVIRTINTSYEYEVNLLKRKEDVIRLIDEKGMLTEELKRDILSCHKLVEVEDLYRPFKEKKKTKATEAIKFGLEPLAKMIRSYNENVLNEASKFINKDVKTSEDAIMGAKYIIAETISDNPSYRKYLRALMYREGIISSGKKKNANDEKMVYEMYYEFSEPIKQCKMHRIMAMNRGEKEDILQVKISVLDEKTIEYINEKENNSKKGICASLINEAIADSYKRLIFPSVEREVRSELKEEAEKNAIANFSDNLEKLLLTPPIKGSVVIGYDPAFRTGCKLAVLSPLGDVLDISVIYPTEPHLKIEESKKAVLDLIDRFKVDIIAIGNGTASRESEKFISDTIKESKRDVKYVIVNEAGASVYSASPLAIKEFPDLTVEKRSAISIGRRLQDALSELVKIEPKSIGVGLYQHDVNAKNLEESLSFTVSKIVNQVGVNVNNASPSILQYISGLNKKAIDALIEMRSKLGKFKSRDQIKKTKGISEKIYEQAIGFLRIGDGDNPLDKTSIHPESYNDAQKLLDYLSIDINEIGNESLKSKIDSVNRDEVSKELAIDIYTLNDILENIVKPARDPRENIPAPLLKSDILTLDDLTVGMKLQGTVRNVVDFGVFIDIGLKNDALAHISELSTNYIKHPKEILNVGDIVDCYVLEIFKEKKKVSVSLIAR